MYMPHLLGFSLIAATIKSRGGARTFSAEHEGMQRQTEKSPQQFAYRI